MQHYLSAPTSPCPWGGGGELPNMGAGRAKGAAVVRLPRVVEIFLGFLKTYLSIWTTKPQFCQHGCVKYFSPETIEGIGTYVYALIDPSKPSTDPRRFFYIGKGIGQRCFQHAE